MSPEQRNVRGIDADLWRELRHAAIDRNLSLGALLNQIVREWLEKNRPAPHGDCPETRAPNPLHPSLYMLY
jgi:hypothetical protein